MIETYCDCENNRIGLVSIQGMNLMHVRDEWNESSEGFDDTKSFNMDNTFYGGK